MQGVYTRKVCFTLVSSHYLLVVGETILIEIILATLRDFSIFGECFTHVLDHEPISAITQQTQLVL